MTKYTSTSVRKMDERDLECVLAWRNHPNIRRFMLTQHVITTREHRTWFNHASKDETRALLLIEENNQPIGCVIFSGAQPNSSAEWSFYASPTNIPGSGVRICSTALDFVFNELKVHKVAGRVLNFNIASIQLHRRLGFTLEGTLREQHLINQTHHDLLCFGILSREWGARGKK